jgi:hypothetical protein
MRTLRMALVGGFAGALMAGNVATVYAAPLPTNVESMKSMVAENSIQMIRWGGWRGGGWGYRGFRGWGWGAGALAGALIGGAIASTAYGYYGGPYDGGLCVPKTLSVLMTPRNHLSWRNDRAPVFRRGGLGLTIQVEDPA